MELFPIDSSAADQAMRSRVCGDQSVIEVREARCRVTLPPSPDSASTMASKKHKLEGPEGEGSNWSDLPQDISESILKLLSFRDYLQFGLVCTSWRTIFANAIASKHCLPAPQLPLLILNRSSPDSNIICPSFFDLSKKKFINPKGPIYERNHYCCGSFEGWFFMIHNLNLSSSEHSSPYILLNPVSGDRIALPSQSALTPHINPNYKFHFAKVVASSSPNSEDCIIVCLLQTYTHLAVCKLVNKCWTLIEAKETMVFLDIEIIGKTLYALVDDGGGESTIFYNLEDANAPKLNMVASLEHKPERRQGTTRVVGRTEYVTDFNFTYFAGDNVSGELLMIRTLVDYASNNDDTTRIRHILFLEKFVNPPHAKEFRVWKLDKCDLQWLELHDLDGRLIYFKGSRSIVISDTSLSDPQEFVKRNCIYFVSSCHEDSLQIEIGRFCMTDKSMKRFLHSDLSAADQAMRTRSVFWFIPNIF
ncbi:hypothetical protein L6164_020724 [Bauhinia variegata]|uniref:Uncharacterized protein n=1 Tax=Bauhinia variegata TaxID=167791 RepID=A0ACB9MZG2_BAUVA|nr:hypothetical protein L6164_020724 [Bauhinia variegata]